MIKINIHVLLLFFFGVVCFAEAQAATNEIPNMLKIYLQNGATAFDASKAKALWSKEFTNAKYSDQRSCATCHTTDLTKPGFHAVSRKEIDPLAVSAGKGRFQDAEKIETWFRRNCKWTWGRECTPQEKGDFLSFFNQL